MLCPNLNRSTMTALLLTGLIASTLASAQAMCSISGTLTIKNNTNYEITGLGVIHRVGKGSSGGVAAYFWDAGNFKGKRSSPREVQSSASENPLKLDFSRPDYWTVVYTRRKLGETIDTVFALNPHNGRDTSESIAKALDSVSGKDLAAIWTAAGATGVVGAAAVPAAKIITTLISQKGASLVGFAGGSILSNPNTNLGCDMNEMQNKEIKIDIGLPGKPDTYNWVYLQIPGRSTVRIGEMVGTLINQETMMTTYKARVVAQAEGEKKPDRGN